MFGVIDMPAAWGISYKERIYGMDPDIIPKCFWTVSTYTGRREYEDIVGRDNDIKSVFNTIKNIDILKRKKKNCGEMDLFCFSFRSVSNSSCRSLKCNSCSCVEKEANYENKSSHRCNEGSCWQP